MKTFPYKPRPSRQLNLVGRRFGPMTVTRLAGSDGKTSWEVVCDCGKTKIKVGSELTKTRTVPKGCGFDCALTKRSQSEKMRTHAMSKHPAFPVWSSMKRRCLSPTHPAWKNYGGRGITVCERWRGSFENFWADMGPTWQKGLDLDRVNNDAGYSPDNCRWATRRQNSCNRRRSLATYEQRILAEKNGIKPSTLSYRLTHGWTVEAAVSAPADIRNSFTTSGIVVRGTALSSEAHAAGR